MTINKKCKKCSGSVFYKSGKCKPCEQLRLKKYYEENKEKAIKRSCDWQKDNKEKYQERYKNWYDENSEQVISKNKEWSSNNKYKTVAYKRNWYLNNKQKANDSSMIYRSNNPLKAKESRLKWRLNNKISFVIYAHNRLKRIKDNGGRLSKGIIESLYKQQNGLCNCCGKDLGSDYELDHIMPIKLCGTNTDDNVQLLTKTCNRKKSCKHPDDYMRSKGMLA